MKHINSFDNFEKHNELFSTFGRSAGKVVAPVKNAFTKPLNKTKENDEDFSSRNFDLCSKHD
jgi:hypothetical protein